MKKYVSHISTFLVVTLSFFGGALFSMASNFATPPDSNTTRPDFEYLTVDNLEDTGKFDSHSNGRLTGNSILPGSIAADGPDIVMPSVNNQVVSNSAGMIGLGVSGIRAQNNQADGYYGRFGLEATVRDQNEEARAYVGYLEYYDGGGTEAEDVDASLMEGGGQGIQYVPLTKGIPWAFYTDGNSKLADVDIEGSIISDPDGVYVDGQPEPYYGIVIQDELTIHGDAMVNPIDGELLGVDDYVATEPMWNSGGVQQVFMVSKSSSTYSANSSAGHKNLAVSCPSGTVRLSCSSRLHSSKPSLSTPNKGVKKKKTRECLAYAEKPVGQELKFYVYAYCMRPNPLFP